MGYTSAIDTLKNQREKTKNYIVADELFNDLVFLSKKGTAIKNEVFNSTIHYYCKKAGLEQFSMHTLRHTFATRCIEAGMKPKTLQMILGHSNLGITMNLYVHIDDEEMAKEINNVQEFISNI